MTNPIQPLPRPPENQTHSDRSLLPSNLTKKVSYFAKAAFFTAAIPFDPFIDFFTQGLSDFLGLETLRHGTNFKNYINIRIMGPDPSKGGTGASYQCLFNPEECIDYFHVAKDSEASLLYGDTLKNILLSQFIIRNTSARFYCAISSFNLVDDFLEDEGYTKTALKTLFAALNTLLVPTVKIRYTIEDAKNIFINDPNGVNMAYKTKMPIPVSRIGLQGIFTEGVKGSILERMKAHPLKSSIGLLKLMNPFGLPLLSAFGLHLLMSKSKSHSKQAT